MATRQVRGSCPRIAIQMTCPFHKRDQAIGCEKLPTPRSASAADFRKALLTAQHWAAQAPNTTAS
eukprot:11500103-Alexandrium_andersonii.AAC.1